MALIFDRLHFPNVRLPEAGYDPAGVRKEIARLEALGEKSYDTAVLIGSLRILEHLPALKQFCLFTGAENQMFGGDLKPASDLVKKLDRAIFGERLPGVIPMNMTGYHKGLPGGNYVDYPSALYYPANAMLYSAKNGIPIVSDMPGIPVFALGDPGDRARNLASVLALKSIEMALPRVPPLAPAEIVELRTELAAHVSRFRISMYRLAGKLAVLLPAGATDADVHEQASFVVSTEVAPALAELETAMRKPMARWLQHGWDITQAGATVQAAYSVSPVAAVITGLISAGVMYLNKDGKEAHSDFYYLLKLRQAAGRR